MAEPMRKDEAHELVNRMPENATWDDLIEEIYVRQVIEQGLADSEAGRTTDVAEVRAGTACNHERSLDRYRSASPRRDPPVHCPELACLRQTDG